MFNLVEAIWVFECPDYVSAVLEMPVYLLNATVEYVFDRVLFEKIGTITILKGDT